MTTTRVKWHTLGHLMLSCQQLRVSGIQDHSYFIELLSPV